MPLFHKAKSVTDLALHLGVCEVQMENNAELIHQGQEMLEQLTRCGDHLEAKLLADADDGNLEQMEQEIQNHLSHFAGPESFFEERIETLGKHGDLLMDICEQFGDLVESPLNKDQTDDDEGGQEDHRYSFAESHEGSHPNYHQELPNITQQDAHERLEAYYRRVGSLLEEQRSGLQLLDRMREVQEEHAKHGAEATGQWEDLLDERKRLMYLLRVVQLLLEKRASGAPMAN